MQTAIVEITNAYGTEFIRPVNEVALNLTRLTGKVTLTDHDIRIAKLLGINFEIKPRTI